MENQYQRELDFARKVVVDAYRFCRTRDNLLISEKGSRDLVTDLDVLIENYIVEQINSRFPEDAILAEENHTNTIVLKHRYWCIDPIDGTVNLTRGIPFFGVQIALVQDYQPKVAAIFLPELDSLYYASIGQGSFLNHQQLCVSKTVLAQKAIVSMGDFSNWEGQEVENARRVKALGGLVNDVLKIKMFGAACLDLVYLAQGRIDIHVMFSFGLWDVLPGLLIASEAGAVYKTTSGQEFTTESQNIVLAASASLLEFIIKRFNELKI
jgi:myo-inositol-1(or 4)-monophosphatase